MSASFDFTDFDEQLLIPENTYIEDLEIEQFTGLLDKNGKEIYEGDIVNDFGGGIWRLCKDKNCGEHEPGHYREPVDRTRLGVIKFDEGYFGVKTKALNYVYIPTPKGSSRRWEVIGNIHENPDLLESGDKQQEA